jgi:DNA-binding NarL/FixJ family response regulator
VRATAYRRAHQLGRDPQPGLALLRLAQGRVDAAAASIRAALAGETQDRLWRARLCAAQVEVALAAEDTAAARTAGDELAATAATYGSSGLEAASRQAGGAVLLAERQLDAAGMVFERLGATLDIRVVAKLRGRPELPGGLTEREAEVLRLVAAGKTNREIAAVLVLSDKTVARHLANIFAKLGLSSRTAAAAYAFERGLASPTRG